MAKKLMLHQARRAALQGQTDTAISALRTIAKTDASASASLAELLAFSDRWEELIPYAGRLIENPSAVYAGNVFDDMIGLLGQAGHKTGHWQQIREVIRSAWDKADQTEKRVHVRKRHLTILNALDTYSLRNGDAPHELIRVFGVSFNFTQADRDASYQRAVYEATHNNDELRQNPSKLTAYLFAIANNLNQPADVINIYNSGGMPANFDSAVNVARIFMDRKDEESSWQVLWKHMSLWWPVDKAQVAPVILLTDVKLRSLMNQERCEQVLALPRGPEADKTIVYKPER